MTKSRLTLVRLEDRTVPALPSTLAVGGTQDGRASVFTPNSAGQYGNAFETRQIFPGFTGDVRTTIGDVNADGKPDTILVTGPGTPIRFAALSGLDNFTVLIPPTAPFPGSESFTGGGFVSAADFDNDGRAEMVFTPDQGGGPRVTIFSLVGTTPTIRASIFGIDDPNFRGGARTATGNVNPDAIPDLAVAAGFEGGPRVALYSGASLFNPTPVKLVPDFFAFPDTLRNGVFVAIGDVNGDGTGDLVFGSGPGGGPVLKIISGVVLLSQGATAAESNANKLSEFFVGGMDSNRSGVRVAIKDADGDMRADVVVGSGGDQPAKVRIYLGKNFSGTSEPGAFQDLTILGGIPLADGLFPG